MTTLSSFILTSNNKSMLKSTHFLSITLIAVLSLHIASCLVYIFAPSLYVSRQLFEYQKNKIYSASSEVETIIIGDSSGGNAINAIRYSQIANEKALNLCLTGSFGIIGSANILEKAVERFPNLHTVIIIHTLDIWGRDITKAPWWLDTYTLCPSNLLKNPLPMWRIFVSAVKYYFTTTHLKNYLYSLLSPNRTDGISKMADYISQGKKTYANSEKTISPDATLDNMRVQQENIMALKNIDKAIESHDLSVFFIHGPLYKSLADNSINYIDKIKQILPAELSNVKFISKVVSLTKAQTGDSVDHTLPAYKNKITKRYYELIKNNRHLHHSSDGL